MRWLEKGNINITDMLISQERDSSLAAPVPFPNILWAKRIEYILERNLIEKSVKRPFCCTVSILQVYFPYLCNIIFWALEHHFIENLKLVLKENQIMKSAGLIIDQWSFHIDSMPFTLQTMIFRYNYKSNDVFYSSNSL